MHKNTIRFITCLNMYHKDRNSARCFIQLNNSRELFTLLIVAYCKQACFFFFLVRRQNMAYIFRHKCICFSWTSLSGTHKFALSSMTRRVVYVYFPILLIKLCWLLHLFCVALVSLGFGLIASRLRMANCELGLRIRLNIAIAFSDNSISAITGAFGSEIAHLCSGGAERTEWIESMGQRERPPWKSK